MACGAGVWERALAAGGDGVPAGVDFPAGIAAEGEGVGSKNIRISL